MSEGKDKVDSVHHPGDQREEPDCGLMDRRRAAENMSSLSSIVHNPSVRPSVLLCCAPAGVQLIKQLPELSHPGLPSTTSTLIRATSGRRETPKQYSQCFSGFCS